MNDDITILPKDEIRLITLMMAISYGKSANECN